MVVSVHPLKPTQGRAIEVEGSNLEALTIGVDLFVMALGGADVVFWGGMAQNFGPNHHLLFYSHDVIF